MVPYGLRVKTHTPKQAFKLFLIPPLLLSPNLSPDAPCGEEKAGLSPKPSPIPVQGWASSELEVTWPHFGLR